MTARRTLEDIIVEVVLNGVWVLNVALRMAARIRISRATLVARQRASR